MAPSDTLETLLDAAAALMAEGGLGEATTAKVARRAGVAEGTIYRHFASKDALVEAVFARLWGRIAQDLEARLPSPADPEARLRAFLPQALAAFQAHPAETALIPMEFLHIVTRHGGCAASPGSARVIGILEEAIRLAQASGAAKAGLDPGVSAAMAWHGVSKTWNTRADPEEAARTFRGIQAFLDSAFF